MLFDKKICYLIISLLCAHFEYIITSFLSSRKIQNYFLVYIFSYEYSVVKVSNLRAHAKHQSLEEDIDH